MHALRYLSFRDGNLTVGTGLSCLTWTVKGCCLFDAADVSERKNRFFAPCQLKQLFNQLSGQQ